MGLKDNEDGTQKIGNTNYAEISKAIYKMKQSGINVLPPSINNSDIDYVPSEEKDIIYFGLIGISGININICQQIIENRPYNSFKNFYEKNCYDGSLITHSKFIQLIKAGCFDEFNSDRTIIMKQYVILSTPIKDTLTMSNLPEILRIKCNIPKNIIEPYYFKKYVINKQFLYGQHPNFKTKKLYWLDNKALKYFEKHCKLKMKENIDWLQKDDLTLIVDKSLEKVVSSQMQSLKDYISDPSFMREYKNKAYIYCYSNMLDNKDTNHWSIESCGFYSNQHELSNINRKEYNISLFDDIPLSPVFYTEKYGKREWKKYELYQIAGTVIDKIDNHHLVTILDINNKVIQCKFDKTDYAYYKAQISDINDNKGKNIIETSWFRRGTTLILTGYRMGLNDFRIKTYKNSIYNKKVKKICSINNQTGEIIIQSDRQTI
jgi:DNA polymerase-3 subunit alpha